MDDSDRWRLADGEAERAPQPGAAIAPLVGAAIIIAALYFARPVLEPFALAVLLSLLLAPAVRWLHLCGLGRIASVCVVVTLAFIVIVGFAAAIGEQVLNLAQTLPRYEANISAKIHSLNGTMPGAGVVGRVTGAFHDLGEEFAAVLTPGGRVPGERLAPVPVEIRAPGSAQLQLLRDIAGPLLGPLASGGLVLVFVVLILLKREDLRDRVLRLGGAGDLHRTTAAMNEAAERLSNYLLMQLAVGICFGLPIGIGLAVIGIPNAPLWGILGVVLRFIPYLGGSLTAVFPIVLAIAVDPGWALFGWAVLLFFAVELVIANVVEPWVYGRSTGLSAVAVIAAAVFWAWLWGVVGLLLATPLTVCLVVLGRHLPRLQFLDILLGNQPALSPEESLYQRLLAGDPEEATEQAEEFAKAKSLDAFFDEVAVAALVMAQLDSDRGVLAARRRAIVAEGVAEMLDNLAEDGLGDVDDAVCSGPTIVCLAGRNELDLAAARLLQHLLRRRGHRVELYGPDGKAAFDLDRLPLRGVATVCLSLVSTSSAARARYLVRRIRRRAKAARLLVGLWGYGVTDSSAVDAAAAADAVVTTLSAAVFDIEAALNEAPRSPASGVVPALLAAAIPPSWRPPASAADAESATPEATARRGSGAVKPLPKPRR